MAKARAEIDGIKVYCRYDELVSVGDFQPHPQNPIIHSAEQVERLAEIFKKNGIRKPITISKLSGYITAGHCRLKAAQLLGLSSYPAEFQDYKDKEAELADLIADNRVAELAEVDEKALLEAMDGIEAIEMTGFSVDELNEIATDLDRNNADEDIDDSANVSEPPEKPFTQAGDLWRIGDHVLLCGDSTEPESYTRILNGDKADLVLTDPPYNVNYERRVLDLEKAHLSERGHKTKNVRQKTETTGKIENDRLSDAAFCEFLQSVFKNIKDSLKGGKGFYFFYPAAQTENFLNSLKIAGLNRKQILIWVKNNIVIGRADYQYKHEPIIYGWTEPQSGQHYFTPDRKQKSVFEDELPDFGKMKKEQLVEWIKTHTSEDLSDIIRADKPLASHLHPTMKPVKLLAQLIRNSSRIGETILEPFAGSGSLIIAAEMTQRKARAIELQPAYCDVIVRRFALTIGKTEQISLERNGQAVPVDEWKHLLEDPNDGWNFTQG